MTKRNEKMAVGGVEYVFDADRLQQARALVGAGLKTPEDAAWYAAFGAWEWETGDAYGALDLGELAAEIARQAELVEL
jgi:hypothetical protein